MIFGGGASSGPPPILFPTQTAAHEPPRYVVRYPVVRPRHLPSGVGVRHFRPDLAGDRRLRGNLPECRGGGRARAAAPRGVGDAGMDPRGGGRETEGETGRREWRGCGER